MYRKYIRLKYSKFTQQLSSEPVENIYNIKIIVIHNPFYRFESILVGRREANEKLVKEKHSCKYPSGEYTHILETRVHLARIILVPPRKLASLVRLYRLFRSAYLSREPWLFCLQHLLRRSYLSFFLSFFSSPAASPLSIYLPYSRSLLSPSLSLSRISPSLTRHGAAYRVAPVFYRGWFPGHGFGQDLHSRASIYTGTRDR